ncbi:regulatory protein RecX [Urechidicola sp. KH5]
MNNKKTYTVEEAKRNIERYCVYQDRCHKEVEKKLREYHMITEAIDHIIVHLIEHNFLNEERFAKSFARGKFRIKKWGKQRIIRELKFRDISTYNIKSALQEISDKEYLQTFDELSLKKYETLKGKSKIQAKKKLADYLLYRGWESAMVYEKLKDLIG